MPAEVITTTVNPQGWGRWSCCYQMHVCVTDESKSKQTVGVWSRERFTAGQSKENRWPVLNDADLPDGFRETILEIKFGGKDAGYETVL